MKRILIGHDWNTGEEIYLPRRNVFDTRTHFHLIGQTGKGKTTALKTMLIPLFQDEEHPASFFIIDPLGLFAEELLMYMASEYCPPHVRDRLLYVEPCNADFVLPFNPLATSDPEGVNYRIHRTKEVILRAWESQDLAQMARLSNWLQFVFEVAAESNLTIADMEHILYHASEYHADIVDRLSEKLRIRYERIRKPNNSTEIILDSTRNRLDPYFTDDILKRTFGSTRSAFDPTRFIEEGRIIIVNLKSENRVAERIASTIGSLMVNEVMMTAKNLKGRYPIYLVLDEFQNFVGPDIANGIADLRNFNVRMIMAHQSLSQLKQGNDDSLVQMIFQAQSRMIFAVSANDAEILSEEIATLDYEPKEVKHLMMSTRQRVAGTHKEILRGSSRTRSDAAGQGQSSGHQRQSGSGKTSRFDDPYMTYHDTEGKGWGDSTSKHNVHAESDSVNEREALVTDYEDYEEIADIAYVSYDEHRQMRRQVIQSLHTGHTVMKLNDDPTIYELHVKQTLPGLDVRTAEAVCPQAIEAVERLKEQNFLSEHFVPAKEIENEITTRLKRLREEPPDDQFNDGPSQGNDAPSDSPFPSD